MFGYRNPLQSVEFELTQASQQPYDEINLNLVEDYQSNSQNGKRFSNGNSNNASATGRSSMNDLQQGFQVVTGGTYKKIAHGIASIDIIYSLFRLAFHFLELITGGLGTYKKAQYYNNNFESNSALLDNFGTSASYTTNISSNEDSIAKKMIPFALSQVAQEEEKSNQTLTVAIWSGKFIVCIIQLIVASALYSGTTNLKDSRISIRNCRIWICTSCGLILILIFEICGILILGESNLHLIAIITCTIELIVRCIGIGFVWKFIKQLKFQLCDLEQDEHIIYYELCPSPSPGAVTAMNAEVTPSTSRRTRGNGGYNLPLDHHQLINT